MGATPGRVTGIPLHAIITAMALGVCAAQPVRAQNPCVVPEAKTCVGGVNDTLPCTVAADCPFGTCTGSGTVTLPPAGCEYLSPTEVHAIIDGLPPGTTIELAPIHKEFICRQGAQAACNTPDGTGGENEQFDSSLELTMNSTSLPSLNRTIVIPNVMVQVNTGPRGAGAVQTFPTEMVALNGSLPAGDPDFAQLNISAGVLNGLPSPGQTTLTPLPTGDFAVDSFFDVFYQIDFVGAPGGKLAGSSGSTIGILRMVAVGVPQPCTTDADCNDGNPCTQDTCDLATGTCTNTPIAGCIPAGDDCWNTECDKTRFSFCANPIPAGFFGTGPNGTPSRPFDGEVRLGGDGNPLTPDTIVRRLQDAVVPNNGDSDTVPIEIISLSLKSCQPITVDFESGSTSLWDVDVTLSPTLPLPPPGSMTITKTHANGGTFRSDLNVQPVFTFTRVGNPSDVRVFDTALEGIPPENLGTIGLSHWVHDDGGLAPPNPICPFNNFVPGVKEAPGPGSGALSPAQPPLNICCTQTGHAGPGGSLHVTGQICVPCPEGACCNTANGSCTLAQGAANCNGEYKGDGTDCADTDGDGIADWFETNNCCDPNRNKCNTGTDPNLADTDGDGFSDGFELAVGCDPCIPDTDANGNGIPDGCETFVKFSQPPKSTPPIKICSNLPGAVCVTDADCGFCLLTQLPCVTDADCVGPVPDTCDLGTCISIATNAGEDIPSDIDWTHPAGQARWDIRANFTDPRTGSGVEGAAASLINGKVYVSHGYRFGDSLLLSVYDIATDTWTHGGITAPDATVVRSEMAGGTALGKHYAIGGRTGPTDQVEEFDPGTTTWTTKAPMPGGPRGGLGAGSWNGKIYAVGGRDGATFGSGTILGTNEEYDASSNTWTAKAPLLIPVSDNYATVALNGKVYVFGGATSSTIVIPDVQIYDIANDTWAFGAPMPTPRAAAMAGVCGGHIYVFGGYDPTSGSNLTVTEVYDPVTDSWSTGPPMLQLASEIAQGVTYDGSQIFAIGSGIFGASQSVVQVLTCEPNWVVADDFVSDGRPITSVRWWGSNRTSVTPPQNPKVCAAAGAICGDPALMCVCSERIDGTLNCLDPTSIAVPCAAPCASDADCLGGTKCFLDPSNPVGGCCGFNCGDAPPPPTKSCPTPGDSPLCPPNIGPSCTTVPGENCHCAREAPQGISTNGAGVCVDSNDFAPCGPVPCAGGGDIVCVAAGLPNTKCVFDNCCGFTCVHNCPSVPQAVIAARPNDSSTAVNTRAVYAQHQTATGGDAQGAVSIFATRPPEPTTQAALIPSLWQDVAVATTRIERDGLLEPRFAQVTWDQMVAFDQAHPTPERQLTPLPEGPAPKAVDNSDVTATERSNPQPAPAPGPGPSILAPPLTTSFQGTIDNNTFIPPDTHGAVGPSHVVEIVNSGFTVFDRAGGVIAPQISLKAFWSSLGTLPGQPASTPFDPKILYDQDIDRWVVVSDGNPNGRDGTTNSWLLVGISQTPVPTGPWNLYGILASINDVSAGVDHTNDWADYPGVGLDANNLIVSKNMFTVAASPSFVHADVWVISKAPMIAGVAALTQGVDYSLFHDPCGTGGFTFQPCHVFGSTPGSAVNHLVDQGWVDLATRARRFVRVKDITGVGAGAVLNCKGGNDWVEVNGYNFLQLDAPQPACSTPIETNDTRLLNAVCWKDTIWTTHSVGIGAPPDVAGTPPSRPEVSWYEIGPTAPGPFPGGVPNQQGRVSDPTLSYYFPSIAVNKTLCVAIGFSGSDDTTFGSGYYTVHDPLVDAAGVTQPVSLLKAGVGPYWKQFSGTRNRWGDFSATVLDPRDLRTFWTVQEYAETQIGGPIASCVLDLGRWGTWWGSFQCDNTPDGWFISFHEHLQKASPEAPPLALYYCDAKVVDLLHTDLPDCQDDQVFEYFANLDQCCLVHANVDSRSGNIPAMKNAFYEEECFPYHMDIQAVIGHKFFQDPASGQCIEVSTGKSATGHFWGWHTTSNENGLISALQTSVTMGPPPANDWLYGPWKNVLPKCSFPNMAFELLTDRPPATEACCFAGCQPCQDLPPILCCNLGGIPQGPGTTCATNPCGACNDGICTAPFEDQCCCPGDCCATAPANEAACADGCDNDCDGCTDGVDADCGGTETSCMNNADDDCDGLVDCLDSDCIVDVDGDGFPAAPCGADCNDNNPNIFPGATEICTDGIDNDCDMLIDCLDTVDCSSDPTCCPATVPPKSPTLLSHAGQNKVRYLSFVPNNPGQITALQVTLVSSATFPAAVGSHWWVGPPTVICENGGQNHGPPGCGPAPVIPKVTMLSTQLQCTRECRDWGSIGDVIHVGDPGIASDGVYEIRAIDCSCDPTVATNFSAPLPVPTSVWSDLVNNCASLCAFGSPPKCGPPNGTIDLIFDCVAIANKFSNLSCAPIKSRTDIAPASPDRVIDILDIVACVQAFKGASYPYPAPVSCP